MPFANYLQFISQNEEIDLVQIKKEGKDKFLSIVSVHSHILFADSCNKIHVSKKKIIKKINS